MTVYLVGAGPGDPGLITARGAELLGRADAVVYDRLAGDALLDLVPGRCRLIDAGKAPGRATMTQAEIDACLVSLGREGLATVVRLKGGDPFVFGRGGEEALALRAARIGYEIVPGVTSAISAPAFAGIPVTHRGLAAQFAVVTGHEEPGKETSELDWQVLARFGGTLLFLMGVGRLEAIAASLIAAGKDPGTACAVVASGTTAAQRTVRAPLAGIAEAVAAAGVGPPAVTVVGSVAALHDAIAWAEARPLHGRRVVVTRAREQASQLSGRLRELGAEVVEVPLIRIEPLAGPLLDAGLYDLVCVTSARAPRLLLDRIGGDARVLSDARIAAIGPGTVAALREVGLVADVVAEPAVAEGLLAAVGDVAGLRVLIARAMEARDTLPDGLRKRGAAVEVVALYRTLHEKPRDPARALAADAVLLTSASAARNLAAALAGHDLAALRCVAIGPVTAAAAREAGLEIAAQAAAHDLDGLVEALLSLLRRPTDDAEDELADTR